MQLRNAILDPIELEREENILLDRWAADLPGLIRDGLPCAQAYCAAPIRVMLLLKEVNGGENWDLRRFLRDGGRPQTWNVAARWVQGILNIETEFGWSTLVECNEERRKEMLPRMCAVNVKKTSGKHTANQREIDRAVELYQDNLRAQIGLYQPDIVICGGTTGQYVRVIHRERQPEWRMTSRGIWYFIEDSGTVIIDYSHPEARTKDCLLHYGLIDAVKEILSK